MLQVVRFRAKIAVNVSPNLHEYQYTMNLQTLNRKPKYQKPGFQSLVESRCKPCKEAAEAGR